MNAESGRNCKMHLIPEPSPDLLVLFVRFMYFVVNVHWGVF